MVTNEEFENFIKKMNLSKKEFAELTSLPYQTVMNWKRNDSVPVWVNSWLENYIEKKKHSKLVEVLKDSGVCGE